MYRDSLAKLLNKFRKDELVDILSQKAYFNVTSLDKNGTKTAIVSRVVSRLEDKLTHREIADLDLIYQQNHPKSKEWTVYFLAEFDAERAQKQELSIPKVLETKLHSKLKCFLKINTCVQLCKDALWIRLSISDHFKNSPPSAVYLVHYPLSPYIMITSMKASHKQYIFQALHDTLGCGDIKQLDLSGKDVQSLADMILNQKSQGSYSEYRMNQVDDNPLLMATLAKRKKSSPGETEKLSEVRLEDENKAENEKNKKWMENAFGSKNNQPILEKVKFTMETSFKETQSLDFKKRSFKCSVKFEGPSVIEGIKNLGEVGIADLPLPAHLANIHSLSKNHFTLVNRKRPRQIDSFS